MMRLKRLVYRLGFRPRPGTILYSPSLALGYAFSEAANALVATFAEALSPVIAALVAVSQPPTYNPRLFADPPAIDGEATR